MCAQFVDVTCRRGKDGKCSQCSFPRRRPVRHGKNILHRCAYSELHLLQQSRERDSYLVRSTVLENYTPPYFGSHLTRRSLLLVHLLPPLSPLDVSLITLRLGLPILALRITMMPL